MAHRGLIESRALVATTTLKNESIPAATERSSERGPVRPLSPALRAAERLFGWQPVGRPRVVMAVDFAGGLRGHRGTATSAAQRGALYDRKTEGRSRRCHPHNRRGRHARRRREGDSDPRGRAFRARWVRVPGRHAAEPLYPGGLNLGPREHETLRPASTDDAAVRGCRRYKGCSAAI